MDDYDTLKKRSLKFKGEKKKKKRKSSKKDDEKGVDSAAPDISTEDAEEHGGWWKVEKYEQIRDDVCIEFLPGCYAKALGNGNIVLGNPHPPGDGPDEEEIFTAICAATNQFALKSGYDKYLSVDTRKRLVGLSEAIGEQESFLPVFENDKTAICAYNGNFLAPDEESEEQPIVAQAEKAGLYEVLNIRVNVRPKRAYKQF